MVVIRRDGDQRRAKWVKGVKYLIQKKTRLLGGEHSIDYINIKL